MKKISLLGLILVIIMIVSLFIGQYEISFNNFIDAILNEFSIKETSDSIYENVIFQVRLPRIIAAVLVGAALSISGVAFQSMFKNPLVSPGILGVLSGASFGAALGMILFESYYYTQISAFIFGIIAVLIAFFIAMFSRQNQLILLILGGVISSAFFSSLLSVTKFLADPYDELPAIVYWLMGSLANVDKEMLYSISIPMIIGMVIVSLLGKYLNVLSLGDEEAKTLGVNVKVVRTSIVVIATLISTFTVLIGGMIGWIGLVIPHIARLLFGANNILLVPISGLLGAIYLLAIDSIARMFLSVEIPIGILTSLIGIPFFAYALKNVKKGWS